MTHRSLIGFTGSTFLVGVLCTACAPSSGGDLFDPEPVTPAWGETSVIEELRFGVESGPAELMFGAINRIAVGQDGSIFVADNQAPIIRKFDTNGTFVRTVGGEGHGPGEYSAIFDMKVLPDGRLAVWDLRNQRLSLYLTDGELLETIPVPRGRGGSGKVLRYDGEGHLYVRTVARSFLLHADRALLKLSERGEELEEIPLPDSAPIGGGGGFSVFDLSGAFLRPFTVEWCWAWSPLGFLIVGRNDRYDLELLKPQGTSHIRRNVDAVPLAPAERDQWEAWAGFFDQPDRASDLPEILPIPEKKPIFRDIYAGEDGRIWVHRYVAAENHELPPGDPGDSRPPLTWYEPPTFDVFESDGKFLGTVVLPDGVRVLHWDGDRMWASHMDAAGTLRVVRLRVVQEDS